MIEAPRPPDRDDLATSLDGGTQPAPARRTLLSTLGEHAGLVVALVLFLVPIIASITLGGLNEDDALTISPAMEFAHGEEINFRTASFHFMGRSIPWVVGPYTGQIHLVENIVAFHFLGYNLVAIRLFPTLFAAATMVMSYVISRMLLSGVVATILVLILAVNPVFVFWSWLEGYHSYLSMATMTTGAILSFLLYFRTDRARYLYLGAFFCGTGLAMKLNFGYWLVIFTPIAMVAAVRRLRVAPGKTVVQLVIALLAFVVGAATWLSYVFVHPEQVSFLATGLAGGTSLMGVNNASTWDNFLFRSKQLWDLFADDAVDLSFGCPPYQPPNLWSPWYLVGSYVVVVVAALLPRPPFRRSALIFLAVSLPILVLLSTTTPTALQMYNATIYYPIPHMFIAVAGAMVVGIIVRLFSGATPGSAPANGAMSGGGGVAHHGGPVVIIATALVALALMLPDARETYAMYTELHETNGCGRMSGAMHDLTAYLVQNGHTRPIAMDWGLNFPIKLASSGQVVPLELFVGFWDNQFWFASPPPLVAEEVAKVIDDPSLVYLFDSPVFTSMQGRLEVLQTLAAERGKQVVPIQEFKQGDGTVLYVVYKVV